MRRKTFDTLVSIGGLLIALVLVIAGSLLAWSAVYINGQVHDQLAAQQIFFPEAGEATADPRIGPFIDQYSGQQLVNGEQARAFADHYIAVHLADSTGGQTYSQLSAASRAAPDDTELAGQVQTAFRGETLRGLLLNAYAFGKMGSIAAIAAVVSFTGAAVLFILSVVGLVHARKTTPDVELGSRGSVPVEALV